MGKDSKKQNKNEPKKKRFNIQEYDVDVEFAQNIVQVLDGSSDMLLNSEEMDQNEDVIKPEKVKRRSFKSFKAKSESGKDYIINVDFAREHQKLSTGGEYILDICMNTPYHGFYFGLYEIGEFKINFGTLELEIERKFPCKYVNSGAIMINKKEKSVYFGLRESESHSPEGPHHYSLVKLDWNSREILWKLPIPAAAMALHIRKNLLFIGLKNGEVQILDLKKSKVADIKENSKDKKTWKKKMKSELLKESIIFNQKVFEGEPGADGEVSRIEYLEDSEKIAVLGGVWDKRGDIAIFSAKGKLLLNERSGSSLIRGIAQTSSGIFILNSKGVLYQIQREITTHIKEESVLKVDLKTNCESNLVVVRDWLCASGPEKIEFFFSKDTRKQSKKHLDDTLARIIVGHKYGVITGDDLGKLRFWKIGDIKVHKDY